MGCPPCVHGQPRILVVYQHQPGGSGPPCSALPASSDKPSGCCLLQCRYTRGTGKEILAGDAPFSGQGFHLLFNLAVGGVHSGVDRATCLATLKTEQYMMVDWVRVYTKKVHIGG